MKSANLSKKGVRFISLVLVLALSSGCAASLHRAIEKGDLDAVRTLAQDKQRVNEFKEGLTPLHHASLRGQLDMVRILLSAGASAQAVSQNNRWTSLHYAGISKSGIEGSVAKITEALIDAGNGVDEVNTAGDTPLHMASGRGHALMTEILLSSGASADVPNRQGISPLHMASRYGQPKIAELLIAKGADVNRVTTRDEHTPLMYAATNGHRDILRLLLTSGAASHTATSDGSTAMHYAARQGSIENVQLLVEHGAQLNNASASLGTPIFAAAHNEKLEVVRYLLKMGAIIENRDAETVETFATALLRRVEGDELLGRGDGSRAIEAYQKSNGYFARALEEYQKKVDENRKQATSLQLKSFGAMLGQALGEALRDVALNYNARAQAQQVGQIMALRNSRSINQYYANNRLYQEAISKRPYIYSASSPENISATEGAGAAVHSKLADGFAKRLARARDLHGEGEKILMCLQAGSGVDPLSCYRPVTLE